MAAQPAPPPPPYPADPGANEPYGDPTQPYEEPSYRDTDPSALTDFRQALDPYGQWAEDPTYGTLWLPSEARSPDFEPYVSAGRWTYDDGWTWVSDYPWGSIPFHYGRWVSLPQFGWAWVPGRAYSGAWVDWRVGDGYVGWAPSPPQWAWRGNVASRLSAPPAPRYHFVRPGNLFDGRLGRHIVTGPAYFDRTTPYVQSAPPARGVTPFRGPAPAVLGIQPTQIVRTPAGDPNLARARTYARPRPGPGVTLRQSPQQPPRQQVPRTPAPLPNAPRRGGPTQAPPVQPAPSPAPPVQRAPAPPQPVQRAPAPAPDRNVAPPARRVQ
ncbi:MAG: hypothetical protein JOZ69_21190 [Myxococcales bacterium]|nr:hypothetical protein [Myxococcales bacterium]